VLTIVAALIATLYLLLRILDSLRTGREARNRFLLTCLVVAQLIINAGLGLTAVRQRPGREQIALANCRKELATIGNVSACTLVSGVSAPPNLWFVLRSLWPDAEMRSVASWDQALSQVLADARVADGSVLVVDWSDRDTLPTNIQIEGLEVDAVTRPQVFMSRQVRAYRVTAAR
jgi:hypothetical protein